MIMFQKRILLAEDDPAILKVLKVRLEHEGFRVILATDGEQVVEAVLEEGPPDLILLDVQMPKLNGYQVCHRLRRNSMTAKIPILILTGSDSELVRLSDQCVELGIDDWMKKPFRTQELLEKVQRLLMRR